MWPQPDRSRWVEGPSNVTTNWEKTMKSRKSILVSLVLLITLIAATVHSQPSIFGGHVPQAGQSGVQLPPTDLYALDADNALWLWRACGNGFQRMIQVRLFNAGESLIGIDFRPADGYLYGLSDKGNLYQIDVSPPGRGNTILVSALNPRFAGGNQSLMDFNPVVNALRLIGSNDQNYAVVNNGSNLNQTVIQTRIAYAAGDRNAGADPNLVGGAYTNNVAGAQTTFFYGLDFDLDILITIAPGANGSSATGGGQLTTIGRLLSFDSNPINITPTADCDIYTDDQGNNLLIGLSGRTLFTLDPTLTVPGQDVTVRSITLGDGGFIDLAVDRVRRRGCY